MLDATALRDHLPRLRRHAYLLTGSRMAADCVVAMAVARLPHDALRRPQAADLAEVYRLLHAAAAQVVCSIDDGLPPPHARLLARPEKQRSLVVLVSVDGVAIAEAATICDLAPAAAADLLAEARTGLEARFRPGQVSLAR